MFSDLPPIDLDMAECRQSQTGDDDLGLYVPPFNPLDVTVKFPAHYELELSSPTLRGFSQLEPSYPPDRDQCGRVTRPWWNADVPRPQERLRSQPFPSHCTGLDPVPYNLVIPRDASPDGWWATERPAIDPNRSAADGSWSDPNSDGGLEMNVGFCRGYPWSEDWPASALDFSPGGSPTFPGYENSGTPGIAMREIHLDPDIDSEQPSAKLASNMTAIRQYFRASAPCDRPPTAASIRQPDEDTVSSSIAEDDDDRIMEDDVRDEDVSDYTPTTPHKSSHRRSISHSGKIPLQPSKRALRSRPPSSSQVKPGAKITKRVSATKTLAPTPSASLPTSAKRSRPACPHCPQSFHSDSALQKHVLAAHTRPFTCSFRRYGCRSTFGSKNEWKRHVSSQHLRLGIYRCDMDKCVPQESKPSHRRKSSSTSLGGGSPAPSHAGSHNDFNRKDLFTQHVRRMHAPAIAASGDGPEASDRNLEAIRQRCWIPLRETPPASICGICPRLGSAPPLGGPGRGGAPVTAWEGPGTWDERMEHVGRHLEKGEGAGEEDEDVGLRDWMRQEGLLTPDHAGGWLVVGCGGRKRGKGAGADMGTGSGVGTRRDAGLGPYEWDGDMDGDGEHVDGEAEQE